MKTARLLPLFLLGLLLLGGGRPAAAGTGARRWGVFRSQSLRVKGLRRTYRLVVPRTALGREPVPLVFAFHGFTQTGETLARSTGLDELALREGFLLVYPDGRNRRWDVSLAGNADIRFFDRLHRLLSRRYRVDPDRVYATGFSMGAAFCNALGFKRGDRLGAIAPHSGFLGNVAGRPDGPAARFAVMVVQGTDDRVIQPGSGRQTRDYYRDRGFEVEYVEVPGLGHSWATAAGINGRIWSFFLAHPRARVP